MPGADGIIGANVFQEFLIRLDPRAHVLELHPFRDRAESSGRSSDPWFDYDGPRCANCDRLALAYRVGHLLLLPATLNGRQHGYFMLDSGSTYSAVSQDLVNRLPGNPVDLLGARGALVGASHSTPVMFDVGAAAVS